MAMLLFKDRKTSKFKEKEKKKSKYCAALSVAKWRKAADAIRNCKEMPPGPS